ncbi:hypothetical protein PTKIN_Ptkin13bG0110400 [Pterospermum kingtungense]
MMPRKNFPVWDLICKNPMFIKAEIHEWSDGEELELVLLQLINMISAEENSAQLIFLIASCERFRPLHMHCLKLCQFLSR